MILQEINLPYQNELREFESILPELQDGFYPEIQPKYRPIYRIDWAYEEGFRIPDSMIIGAFAYFSQELCKILGFSWIEIRIKESVYYALHSKKTLYTVNYLDNIICLVQNCFLYDDRFFTKLFFKTLCDQYDIDPSEYSKYHPLLDYIYSKKFNNIVDQNFVTKFETYRENPYFNFQDYVNEMGFECYDEKSFKIINPTFY